MEQTQTNIYPHYNPDNGTISCMLTTWVLLPEEFAEMSRDAVEDYIRTALLDAVQPAAQSLRPYLERIRTGQIHGCATCRHFKKCAKILPCVDCINFRGMQDKWEPAEVG